MSWLTNFVRPKIQALVKRRDVPENLWVKCSACEQMIFHRDLKLNLHVCQNCGRHMRILVTERMSFLFDKGVYKKVDLPDTISDPLKFRDSKRYSDRLKLARAKTKQKDAAVVGYGTLLGIDVVMVGLDFSFMGGSMGVAVGEAFVQAAELAIKRNSPLIAITASGGARMQEGALSLVQMPRTVIAVQMVKAAGLPYIVLLTDPTMGGVSASFAMLGDVHITEPGAMIGFAGPRVISETVRETLPENFQSAEFLLEHGLVDLVTKRSELRETLGRVVSLLHQPNVEANVADNLVTA